jgi:hypothetical protein
MCGTNEETICYFAQTAVLRGHVVGNGWEFLLSDAQPFCEAWRNEKTRRWSSEGGEAPQSPLRRAGGFGIDAINFGASVVSLAAAFGLDGNRAVGVALAALNAALAAFHGVWAAVRRSGRYETTADTAVDPDAVAWASGDGSSFPLRGLQVACLVTTVGFVAVTASPEMLRSVPTGPTSGVDQPAQAEPPVAPPVRPQDSATGDAANPCASLPVYAVGSVVSTTAEINLREGPSTDSAAVVVLPPGTRLQVTGEFQEAGQCDWWPVTVVDTGQSGFILEQYLEPSTS